jgi:predicted O-methyltransferase YrrM
MTITNTLNRLLLMRNRLKATSRTADFVDEQLRDWIFHLDSEQRRALRREWRSCRTLDDLLRFAARHFGAAQKDAEIVRFLSFAHARKPIVVCEIGTYCGGTHLLLTHGLPTVWCTVAIDLLVRNKSMLRLLRKDDQEAHIVEAYAARPTTINRVRSVLEGREIDVLFIGGDHRYYGVLANFLSYRPFVREGGIIAFHDICATRSVARAPAWAPSAEGPFSGGVPEFWRRIRQHFEHREFIAAPVQEAHGIGALIQARSVRLPLDF